MENGFFPTKPIADHFENVSVFFADLVGFTAWASQRRDPAAVFELLEGIYGAFDKVAVRRKVFNVETIGGTMFFARFNLPTVFLSLTPYSFFCRLLRGRDRHS